MHLGARCVSVSTISLTIEGEQHVLVDSTRLAVVAEMVITCRGEYVEGKVSVMNLAA